MLYCCRNRRNLTYVHWHQNRSRSNSSLNDITLIHWSLKSIQKQSFFFENPWLEMTTLNDKKKSHTSILPMRLSIYITSVTKSCQNTNKKQQVRNIIGGIHRLLNHMCLIHKKMNFQNITYFWISEYELFPRLYVLEETEESRRKKGLKDTFLKTKWCFINCWHPKSQTNISRAPRVT